MKHIVALLILGSATLLLSCKSEEPPHYNPETLITQQTDTLTMIVSNNGRKQYRFEAPLMERYELAREPYMEYRKGIYLETFRDSTQEIESTILADYAIRYESREVWEARGNVVATGYDDRTLYTEQLFWDEKTSRIYSNVDSRVVQGDDVFLGEGFESDDRFEHWTFRNYTGRLAVDVSPNEGGNREAGDGQNAAEPQPTPDAGIPASETQGKPADAAPPQPKPSSAPEPQLRPFEVRQSQSRMEERMLSPDLQTNAMELKEEKSIK